MDTPYSAPETSPDVQPALAKSKKSWFRAVWISAALVVVPPFFGLIGTVVGMVGAFGELEQTGEADPEALAGDISIALLTTAWGLVISFLALIAFVVSLVVFLKKRRALREVESPNRPNKSQ